MTPLKKLLVLLAGLLLSPYADGSFALSAENLPVNLVALDPQTEAILGSDELLYGLVQYESDIPLRFQAIAMREEAPLEVGATSNPAILHAPGRGEALVWVGYANPTHIDAVRVTVLDEEWQEMYQLSRAADVTWQGTASSQPRQPAEWVAKLIKSEKRKMDYVYDPAPQKYGTLYDLFFFVSVASIPAYILLQLHMLWHYRYRWRELACVPIFPYLILAFYALAGLGIETSLQVIFLFRYTPLALLYLVCLWLAKRFWEKKLPPPKLYKQSQK